MHIFQTALLVIITGYVLCLWLANRLPRVSVRGLGWFSLLGVTVTAPGNKGLLKIGRLSLRINATWNSALAFKLLSVQFFDVELKLQSSDSGDMSLGTSDDKLNTSDDKLNTSDEKLMHPDELSLPINRKLLAFLRRFKVADKIALHAIRVTVCALEHHALFFNIVKLEKVVDDGKVILSILDATSNTSSLRNNHTPLFKSVSVTLDLVVDIHSSPSDETKSITTLTRASCSLSSAGLNASLENLIPKNKEPNVKPVQVARTPQQKIQDLVQLHRSLESWLPIAPSVELKLEDFCSSSGDWKIEATNLAIKVENGCTKSGGSNARFSAFVTAFDVYHKNDRLLNLPSGSFQFATDPVAVIETMSALLGGDIEKATCGLFEFMVAMTLTYPKIDIYEDQLKQFTKYKANSSNKKSFIKSGNSQDFGTVFKKLSKVSAAATITGPRINLHLLLTDQAQNSAFERGSKENLVVTIGMETVFFGSRTRHLDGLRGLQLKKTPGLKSIFKMRHAKLDAAGNLLRLERIAAVAMYDIVERSLSLQLKCRAFEAKSANVIIFHLLRMAANDRNTIYNETYAELVENADPEDPRPFSKCGDLDLFTILPLFVSKVDVDLELFQTNISCCDFLPSHMVYDEHLDREIDLGKYNRGVSAKVERVKVRARRIQKQIAAEITNLQCFSVSDCPSEVVADFDDYTKPSENTDLDTLDSRLSSLSEEELKPDPASPESQEVRHLKKVLVVPTIKIKNSDEHRPNALNVFIPEADSRIDIFLIWCAVYAHTLFKFFEPTVTKTVSKQEMSRVRAPRGELRINVHVQSLSAIVRLPNAVDIMLELDQIRLSNVMAFKSVSLHAARLYVVHPATKLWASLLSFHKPTILISLKPGDIEDLKVDVNARSLRILIPHGFLVYTVIDNVVTMFKTIVQIKHNFKLAANRESDFSAIRPAEKPPIILPQITIDSEVLGLSLDTDPFESEISYICELGLIEQRARLKEMRLFEARAEEMLDEAAPSIEEKVKLVDDDVNPLSIRNHKHRSRHPTRPTFLQKRRKRHTGNSSAEPETENVTDTTPLKTREEVESLLALAKDKLYQEFSTSWIKSFRAFRERKISTWARRREGYFGLEVINPAMSRKFGILKPNDGPDAMVVGMQAMHLKIQKAKLDDVDKFIYDHAQGQPKLTYSILVPVLLELKARSMRMYMRDYPLPVMSFPENEDPSKPTLCLSTTLVVNEMLVHRNEEMRFIYVPYSPALPEERSQDNFYSTNIPRTLTPVKIALELRCKLTSTRPCMVTWCPSYQPAFHFAGPALDNFTKPEIDDLPLGTWDKLALILHGNAVFEVENELTLHIKSSSGPYDTTGKAAGFAFCWKDNVRFSINESGDSRELLKVESDHFLLAVPNYNQEERRSWSLLSEHTLTEEPEYDDQSQRFVKRVVKLSSPDKVCWTFGASFERNKDETVTTLSDNNERTSKFKPHYEVRVTSPEYEDHPDSYLGFRSDYIHLALSVISKSENPDRPNVGYFLPLIFQYFFYWWGLLTDGISFPVRKGKLFQREGEGKLNKTSPSMGAHIYTVKYQFIFNPLTIAHVYDGFSDLNDKPPKTNFIGLKGKFETCSIDLHQRKEVFTYINEKLGIKNETLHLKMNEGEVNAEHITIRLMEAVFDDSMSTEGELISRFRISGDHGNHKHRSKIPGSEFCHVDGADKNDEYVNWFDADDYVELENFEPPSGIPRFRALRFASTPMFSYFREWSLQQDGKYPFGHEDTHHCLMGAIKPSEVQTKLLSARMEELQEQASSIKEKLRSCKKSDHDEFSRELEAIESRISVVADVKGNFQHCGKESSRRDSKGSNLSRVNTSSLALFPTCTTLDHEDEISKFHNRFIVHNIRLKADNVLRDLFMKYLAHMLRIASRSHFMTKEAVDLVQSIIGEKLHKEDEQVDVHEEILNLSHRTTEEVVQSFDRDLSETCAENQECVNKYLVKFIHPQIQMVSAKKLDSCALVTSQDIELRVVSVNKKGTNHIISEGSELSNLFESRYGVLLRDSHIFVFDKSEDAIDDPTVYYERYHGHHAMDWLPWLECEVCYDSKWTASELIMERNTTALMHRKQNPLSANANTQNDTDELNVYLAKIVMSATSDQYSTMYYIVNDLLINGKDARAEALGLLSKIVSMRDLSDFAGLDTVVHDLQQEIRFSKSTLLQLPSLKLKGEIKSQFEEAVLELTKMELQLDVLMLETTMHNLLNSSSNRTRVKRIMADQVIWHIMDDLRQYMVDLALSEASFVRIDSPNRLQTNAIKVQMMQGFYLQPNVVYPDLLGPLYPPEDDQTKDGAPPLFLLQWETIGEVGGIPIVEEAKFALQPLKVALDYSVAKMLIQYVWPKDENDSDSESSDSDSGGDTASILTEDTTTTSTRVSRNPLRKILARHKDSFSSEKSPPLSPLSRSSDDSGRSSTKSSEAEEVSSPQSKTSVLKPIKAPHEPEEEDDDLQLFIERSAMYKLFRDTQVKLSELNVSFNGPKSMRLLNVHDLKLELPLLHYTHKTWCIQDMTEQLKKDVTKAILRHTGRFLGNKFTSQHHAMSITTLDPIYDYTSYVRFKDLKGSKITQNKNERSPMASHITTSRSNESEFSLRGTKTSTTSQKPHRTKSPLITPRNEG